jgi:hypothetical protein
MERPQQTARHVTALSPLQQRILEVLGFSSPLLCFAIAGVNVILLGPIPSFG